jgi:hypothetical protein
MEEAITVVVALIGVALASLGFWRDFPDLRSRRYIERFKGLLEMSDVLAARGPYAGPNAAAAAAAVHDSMLAGLDLEARANAVMYMNSAGRLRRPGSMSVAVGMVLYGVIIVWLVLAGVLPTTPAEEAVTVTTSVSQYILLGIALVSFGGGVVVGARRWVSRRIRLSMGHEDELTVVWWKRVGSGFREVWVARGGAESTAASA